MQQKRGKLLTEPMARRIAIEIVEERIESPPRSWFDRGLGDRARNLVGAVGFIDQPFDCGNPPVALARDLTGQPRQQSKCASALDFG